MFTEIVTSGSPGTLVGSELCNDPSTVPSTTASAGAVDTSPGTTVEKSFLAGSPSTSNMLVGVIDCSNPPASFGVGSSADSIGYFSGAGQIYVSGIVQQTLPSYGEGDLITVRVTTSGAGISTITWLKNGVVVGTSSMPTMVEPCFAGSVRNGACVRALSNTTSLDFTDIFSQGGSILSGEFCPDSDVNVTSSAIIGEPFVPTPNSVNSFSIIYQSSIAPQSIQTFGVGIMPLLSNSDALGQSNDSTALGDNTFLYGFSGALAAAPDLLDGQLVEVRVVTAADGTSVVRYYVAGVLVGSQGVIPAGSEIYFGVSARGGDCIEAPTSGFADAVLAPPMGYFNAEGLFCNDSSLAATNVFATTDDDPNVFGAYESTFGTSNFQWLTGILDGQLGPNGTSNLQSYGIPATQIFLDFVVPDLTGKSGDVGINLLLYPDAYTGGGSITNVIKSDGSTLQYSELQAGDILRISVAAGSNQPVFDSTFTPATTSFTFGVPSTGAADTYVGVMSCANPSSDYVGFDNDSFGMNLATGDVISNGAVVQSSGVIPQAGDEVTVDIGINAAGERTVEYFINGVSTGAPLLLPYSANVCVVGSVANGACIGAPLPAPLLDCAGSIWLGEGDVICPNGSLNIVAWLDVNTFTVAGEQIQALGTPMQFFDASGQCGTTNLTAISYSAVDNLTTVTLSGAAISNCVDAACVIFVQF